MVGDGTAVTVNAPHGDDVERLSKPVSVSQGVPTNFGIWFSLAENGRSLANNGVRFVKLPKNVKRPPDLVLKPALIAPVFSFVPSAEP